jgi:putative colanic acid biosynthesis UDP-glucose lipid carrier transferase
MLLIDLLIINTFILYVSEEYLAISFLIYINLFWVLSSFFSGFYQIFRYINTYKIIRLLLLQFILFFLGFFTYFTLFREGEIINSQSRILSLIVISVSFFKFLVIYALKKYRSEGKNSRKIIVLGIDAPSKKIIELFKRKKSLGYVFVGFFSDNKLADKELLGCIEDSFKYLSENEIDEIYCTLSVLDGYKIKQIWKFANEHNIIVKLIPQDNELYSKSLNTQYYDGTTVVLNVEKLPFEYSENHLIKRIFDVIFSIVAIVGIMSWLTPIIWIIIKLESKGPAFFRQQREGLSGKQFACYKFRSMKIDVTSNSAHTIINDIRVTKFGAFLRKTSLDELPQFFNVLKGNMSVVGPRPHLKSLSIEYQKDVGNYIERHAVKPGITGLAQISGYRGEIKSKSDIQNRVRLDIFYIENWSFYFDIKIILYTIFNVFKGEDKAY